MLIIQKIEFPYPYRERIMTLKSYSKTNIHVITSQGKNIPHLQIQSPHAVKIQKKINLI